MSVNRKRKKLEEKGLLTYYADFCHGEYGVNDFPSKELYIIKFKSGVTREDYIEFMKADKKYKEFLSMFVVEASLGEKDGRLSLIMIMNGKNTAELVEMFNSQLVNMLRENFGENCIIDIITARITDTLRTKHNYLPHVNVENGIMKRDWPDEWIFVDRKNHAPIKKITGRANF